VSILSPLNRRRHLGDDAIAALWSARVTAGAGEGLVPDSVLGEPGSLGEHHAHIRSCAKCRARFDALAGWLEDARLEAVDEADEVFSPERLATQHAQILRRLETLERPGRVIVFPRFAGPVAARRGPQRWIAAAAVAGLIVGLGAGELLDFRRNLRGTPGGHLSGPALVPVSQSARGSIQPVTLSSDDSFLYDDSDAASTSPSVEALQALDALTPRVRDLDQAR
jgi:hypothetical protein